MHKLIIYSRTAKEFKCGLVLEVNRCGEHIDSELIRRQAMISAERSDANHSYY